MVEKMSLQAVRDGMARCLPKSSLVNEWIAALDAHLTQPAQAVDVDAIRRLVATLSEDRRGYTLNRYIVDYLTAAIPKDSNGAEGAGHG